MPSNKSKTYFGAPDAKEYYNTDDSNKVFATSNGIPFEGHPYESQRAGIEGALVLQDFQFMDTLSHFDRERIPERVVHAKGGGAHGYFESFADISDVCKTKFLSTCNKKTPLTIRFSTVGGESGSADTARDPRGFAIKFYTEEGNMDWVFNNTPVFFIRDPLKFPHFIHTQKRNPQTHLNSAADSTLFWDYITLNHESLHQVAILMGDRGIPDSWRHMHGYSGHTYKFINNKNETTYVQIHLRSEQGTAFFTQEEANKLAGEAPDHNNADLFSAIEKGDYPSWEVSIQTMTEKQAENFKYSINDLTKVWPQNEFPLRPFGRIVLNKNVSNYFSEIEQIAFSPSNLLSGIEPSLDPVLQSRLFSYPDTQRHRLGVNYQQLPINKPQCPFSFRNFQRDGPSNFENQGNSPNYIASYRSLSLQSKPKGYGNNKDLSNLGLSSKGNKHNGIMRDGIQYFLSAVTELDYEQPRILYQKVFDASAKKRFISNIVGHASTIRIPQVKQRVADSWWLVDHDLGIQIAKGLGVKEPKNVKIPSPEPLAQG